MNSLRALRFAGLLTVVALAAGCGRSADTPKQQSVPEVSVQTLAAQTAPLERSLVGRLSAYRSADVRARVAGVLLKRSFVEGSDVAAGQSLFQIDPAPLRATLNARLADLAAAEATYTNNRLAAERARSVGEQGLLSRAAVDAAEAAERTAAAAVKQARANVESAEINLGYANVTSPISGRAGRQQVTEGALVGESGATLLTTVEQIDPLYVNFSMSVVDIEAMRQASTAGVATLADGSRATVRIRLPDGSDYSSPGTLDFSDAAVDPATGAVALRALVPNPDHVLLPGMYVNLTAVLGQRHQVYLVPQRALQRDAIGAFLLAVGEDGLVARKNVETDGTIEGNWVVTSGLVAGERIIVSGLQHAKVGAPAKAVPLAPSAAPADSGAGVAAN